MNPFRDLPPMPTAVMLAATMRETGLTDQRGERNELAVARVDFVDVVGDHRTMDFTPELAMDLLRQLANFITQVGVQGRP